MSDTWKLMQCWVCKTEFYHGSKVDPSESCVCGECVSPYTAWMSCYRARDLPRILLMALRYRLAHAVDRLGDRLMYGAYGGHQDERW